MRFVLALFVAVSLLACSCTSVCPIMRTSLDVGAEVAAESVSHIPDEERRADAEAYVHQAAKIAVDLSNACDQVEDEEWFHLAATGFKLLSSVVVVLQMADVEVPEMLVSALSALSTALPE